MYEYVELQWHLLLISGTFNVADASVTNRSHKTESYKIQQ